MINPPSNLSENIFSTTTAATGIVGPAYDRGDAGTLCRVLVSPKEVPARGVFRGVKVRGGGISPLIRVDEGLWISWLESASKMGLEVTRAIPGGQDSIDLGGGATSPPHNWPTLRTRDGSGFCCTSQSRALSQAASRATPACGIGPRVIPQGHGPYSHPL